LLLAGQFFSEAFAKAFRASAVHTCPSIRLCHIDGADAGHYTASFSAADIFISLADSIQETFGITPIEAMAAGLPLIVSDWNGYRDTVRDGIDGFLIDTWAPGPGGGERAAAAYEASLNFDDFSSRTSGAVSVDMAMLVDRLDQLVSNVDLRCQMGEAGRTRAIADYDWTVIYGRYRELWAELTDIRNRALAEDRGWLAKAPRAHPAFEDPYDRFASYATSQIGTLTTVNAVMDRESSRYEELTAQLIFAHLRIAPELAAQILNVAASPLTISELAGRLKVDTTILMEIVGRLAKMNLVKLSL